MKYRFKRSLAILIALALIIIGLYFSGAGSNISFEAIKQQSGFLKVAVENNYPRAVLVFIFLFIILIAITLPIVGPLTLLGGYLFGLLPGFIYSLIGSTIGSAFSFLLIKYVVGSIMRDRYKDQLSSFQEKMQKHGYSYLLMLQLLSVVPFVVINTLAALTDVRLWTLFITTLIGTAPLLFIYAWAGRQLGTISSMKDIVSPQLLLILLILAAISLLPIFFKKWTSKEE
jgi:uncharacterized membrane protein YdjX (TVP38/TMEM64 family)